MDDSKKLVRFVEVKKILFYYKTGELGRMVRPIEKGDLYFCKEHFHRGKSAL